MCNIEKTIQILFFYCFVQVKCALGGAVLYYRIFLLTLLPLLGAIATAGAAHCAHCVLNLVQAAQHYNTVLRVLHLVLNTTIL